MNTKFSESETFGATQSSHHTVVSISGTKRCCSILSQIKQSGIYYRNDFFHVGWFIHRMIFLLGGKAKEEQSLHN